MPAKKYFTEEERKEAQRASEKRSRARESPERKAIRAQQNRENYQRHKEKKKARKKAFYHANRDRMLAEKKEYGKKNRDTLLQRISNRYAVHKDSINERRRKEYEEDPSRAKSYNHNRRKRPGRLSAEDIRQLNRMSDELCAYCIEKQQGRMHVEHCIPLGRGGTNYQKDCVMSCAQCNLNKKHYTPLEFQYGWDKVTRNYNLQELTNYQPEEVVDLRSLCTYVKP